MQNFNIGKQTEEIYREHQPWLIRWLQKRLGCFDTSADLAQDTFVRLLNRPRDVICKGAENNQVRAYLSAIARGICIDHWRRKDIERAWLEVLKTQPENVEPSPEHLLLVIETLLSFKNLLKQLPKRVADAFVMSQIQGLTYKEIAVELKVSERTVKKYMARAMLHCSLNLPKLKRAHYCEKFDEV